jgi:OOP family OmpA-OmpF porin
MNRLNKASLCAALAGLLAVSGAAVAATNDNYFFVDGAWVRHDKDRIPQIEEVEGLRAGIGSDLSTNSAGRLALEFGFFSNQINGVGNAGDGQVGLTADLLHYWRIGRVEPYVGAGIGSVREDINNRRTTSLTGQVDAGFLFRLGAAPDSIGLRLGMQTQYVANDETNPNEDGYTDYRALLGLVIPLSTHAAPAPVVAAPPKDSDGDGVADAQDACPAQPAATADGCPAAPIVPKAPPRDSDGDGIDDTKDECPGTLEGLNVDSSGCVTTAAAQKVVLKGVTFVPGSAELTPDAKKVLDEAYDALAGQTTLRVELGGHTDSVGDDKLNLSLSQRRADSVKKYLAGKGIAASRLEAKGYGETQPIADNKTKAGRQENRRVEFKILN